MSDTLGRRQGDLPPSLVELKVALSVLLGPHLSHLADTYGMILFQEYLDDPVRIAQLGSASFAELKVPMGHRPLIIEAASNVGGMSPPSQGESAGAFFGMMPPPFPADISPKSQMTTFVNGAGGCSSGVPVQEGNHLHQRAPHPFDDTSHHGYSLSVSHHGEDTTLPMMSASARRRRLSSLTSKSVSNPNVQDLIGNHVLPPRRKMSHDKEKDPGVIWDEGDAPAGIVSTTSTTIGPSPSRHTYFVDDDNGSPPQPPRPNISGNLVVVKGSSMKDDEEASLVEQLSDGSSGTPTPGGNRSPLERQPPQKTFSGSGNFLAATSVVTMEGVLQQQSSTNSAMQATMKFDGNRSGSTNSAVAGLGGAASRVESFLLAHRGTSGGGASMTGPPPQLERLRSRMMRQRSMVRSSHYSNSAASPRRQPSSAVMMRTTSNVGDFGPSVAVVEQESSAALQAEPSRPFQAHGSSDDYSKDASSYHYSGGGVATGGGGGGGAAVSGGKTTSTRGEVEWISVTGRRSTVQQFMSEMESLREDYGFPEEFDNLFPMQNSLPDLLLDDSDYDTFALRIRVPNLDDTTGHSLTTITNRVCFMVHRTKCVIVTYHACTDDPLDGFQREWESGRHSASGVERIAETMIRRTLRSYHKGLTALRNEFDALQSTKTDDDTDRVQRLSLIAKKSAVYKRCADANREALVDLDDVDWMAPFVKSLCDQLETTSSMADEIASNALGAVDLTIALSEFKSNTNLKTFTYMTILLQPVSVATSWYGMNWSNMPELLEEHGYFLFAGLVWLIAFLIFIYFVMSKDIWEECVYYVKATFALIASFFRSKSSKKTSKIRVQNPTAASASKTATKNLSGSDDITNDDDDVEEEKNGPHSFRKFSRKLSLCPSSPRRRGVLVGGDDSEHEGGDRLRTGSTWISGRKDSLSDASAGHRSPRSAKFFTDAEEARKGSNISGAGGCSPSTPTTVEVPVGRRAFEEATNPLLTH